MKFLLSALAAAMLLLGVAVSQPAEARCIWDGYYWHCWHPQFFGYVPHRLPWWWEY